MTFVLLNTALRCFNLKKKKLLHVWNAIMKLPEQALGGIPLGLGLAELNRGKKDEIHPFV